MTSRFQLPSSPSDPSSSPEDVPRPRLASADTSLDAQLAQAAALVAKGQAASALPTLRRLLSAARRRDAASGMRTRLLIGRAHAVLGAWNEAIAHWARALELALAEQDRDACIEGWLSLGELYLEHDDAAHGYECIELACSLAQGTPAAMRAHIDLAAALIALGDPDLARAALDVARDALVADQPGLRARLQQLYGTLAEATGDLAAARRHVESALALQVEACSTAGQAQCQLALGRLALAAGEDMPAEQALLAALRLSEQLSAPQPGRDAHLALSGLYEGRGDYVAATRHYAEYYQRQLRIAGQRRRSAVSNQRLAHIEMRLKLLTSEIELWQLREESDAGRVRMRELQEAAYRDALTGVYNRRALNERLPELLAEAENRQQSLSLLLIDFDHFKQVNDRYSHAVGDMVLRAGATLFRDERRSVDLLARYGGEEFALLLPGADLARAREAAERLRERVEHFQWSTLEPALTVTVSVGCAELGPGDSADILFSRADLALYMAKRNGRNRVSVESGF